jgi:hypothetical protein
MDTDSFSREVSNNIFFKIALNRGSDIAILLLLKFFKTSCCFQYLVSNPAVQRTVTGIQ